MNSSLLEVDLQVVLQLGYLPGYVILHVTLYVGRFNRSSIATGEL